MTEFIMGARVSCTDGFCGVLRRTIVDPAARTVTHLVVEPGHHHHTGGRLVPIELAEEAAGEIRLRCTLDEFGRLSPAEEIDVAGGGYGGGYGEAEVVDVYGTVGSVGPGASAYGPAMDQPAPVVVSHAVPLGEAEVERHERVHATDGEIGRVEGFVLDPADHKVTHVLLQEGHLWGRRQIAIPVSAVASVDDGIELNITKQQIEELPPLDPAG
jgi:sporulation protein YlmC with PRC-barrel domain